jgi:hypothetical protein
MLKVKKRWGTFFITTAAQGNTKIISDYLEDDYEHSK